MSSGRAPGEDDRDDDRQDDGPSDAHADRRDGDRLQDAPSAPVVPAGDRPAALEQGTEPPVIARLVVEIRSDGRRTIARGALEDVNLGQRVAIQAEGTTPLALARSLAQALVTAPLFGSLGRVRALLGSRSRRGK